MSVEIKRRRGTTEEHAYFKGAVGEITIDTTKNTVVVHDGKTLGGHPLATEKSVKELDTELRELINQSLSFEPPNAPEDPGEPGEPGEPVGTTEKVLVDKEFQSYYEALEIIENASGTVNIDLAQANVYQINMADAIHINMIAPTVPENKAVSMSIIIKQPDNPKAVIWSNSVKWSRNKIPELLVGNRTYVFTLLTTNGGMSWIGLLVGEEIDY